MNASPGSDYHFVGDCENGCKCWAKCNDVEQKCLKKRGECLAEDPNPIGQILYKKIGICQGGCHCWVKRQEPDGWRVCDDEKCLNKGGHCNSLETYPGHKKDGFCKLKCNCWIPLNGQ